MSANHKSVFSGHLGSKKTEVRILQAMIRFCRSCDVCQRTIKKGIVAGHQYILTLVHYATRYPEAVPLKKITSEAVAEALLETCSRVGIHEEVLTDQGTQFIFECMQEVSRLLSIKGLIIPQICNGLVERWSGTLKSKGTNIPEDYWALELSILLQRKLLDVYAHTGTDKALDYKSVKLAFMKDLGYLRKDLGKNFVMLGKEKGKLNHNL